MVTSYVALRLTWRYLWISFILMIIGTYIVPHIYHIHPEYILQEMLIHERVLEILHLPLLLLVFLGMSFFPYKEFSINFGADTFLDKAKVWWAWWWRTWPIVTIIVVCLQILNFQTSRQFEWSYYLIATGASFFVDFKVLKHLLTKKAEALGIKITVAE